MLSDKEIAHRLMRPTTPSTQSEGHKPIMDGLMWGDTERDLKTFRQTLEKLSSDPSIGEDKRAVIGEFAGYRDRGEIAVVCAWSYFDSGTLRTVTLEDGEEYKVAVFLGRESSASFTTENPVQLKLTHAQAWTEIEEAVSRVKTLQNAGKKIMSEEKWAKVIGDITPKSK